MFGDEVPVRFQYWDGSGQGPTDGPGTVHVRSADALRHLLWSPGELGVGRAFVAGHLDVEGDAYATLKLLGDAGPDHQLAPRAGGARPSPARPDRSGVLKGPLPPPPEEVRPRGWGHSRGSDSRAIGHHYDVGNDFYRLMLGPSMTYSCARFTSPGPVPGGRPGGQVRAHLPQARPRTSEPTPARLLDVGCGWGSLAIHAATHHGAPGGGRHHQPGPGRAGPQAGGGGGHGRPGRDPHPGLPGRRRRGVRRHLVGGDVRARRGQPHGPVLRHPPAPARPRGTAPQPRHLGRRRVAAAAAVVHVPLRLPRRRAGRRGRGGAGHGAGRVRGARRGVAPGALRPHRPPLDRQPGGGLGRGGGRGRLGPGPGSGGSTPSAS